MTHTAARTIALTSSQAANSERTLTDAVSNRARGAVPFLPLTLLYNLVRVAYASIANMVSALIAF